MNSLRCSFCRRKAVDYAHHLPVCVEHDGMKFWKQHGKRFIAICQLETDHLQTIIRNLVNRAQKEWAQAAFEESLASTELSVEGETPEPVEKMWMHWTDCSHYLLEPLLREAEKRGLQCFG